MSENEFKATLAGVINMDMVAAQQWDAFAQGKAALVVVAGSLVDTDASLRCLTFVRQSGTANLFLTSKREHVTPVLAVDFVRTSEPEADTSPLTGKPLVDGFDPETGVDWSGVTAERKNALRWAVKERRDLLGGMTEREVVAALTGIGDPFLTRLTLAWDALPSWKREQVAAESRVKGGVQTVVSSGAPATTGAYGWSPATGTVEAFVKSRGKDGMAERRNRIAEALVDDITREDLILIAKELKMSARVDWGQPPLYAFTDCVHLAWNMCTLDALIAKAAQRNPALPAVRALLNA